MKDDTMEIVIGACSKYLQSEENPLALFSNQRGGAMVITTTQSKAATAAILTLAISVFILLAGCTTQSPTTGESQSISSDPVYRLSYSQVRDDSDRMSAFEYEDGRLVESYEYESVYSYTYENGGDALFREEMSDGNNGLPGPYDEIAVLDDKGRIASILREFQGSTVVESDYSYYGDTVNLKTEEAVSGPYTTTTTFNENGWVVSREKFNANDNSVQVSTFEYDDLEDGLVALAYTDYDGSSNNYIIGLDSNGNIETICDGDTYIDFVYEEIENPSAWLFTETSASAPMLGYTTRSILDAD